jgi:hypothetical protein
VADVENLEGAGVAVAQQHVGFAGIAAEIAEAGNRPLQAHHTDGDGAGDGIAADIVDGERAGRGVAQHQVGRIAAVEAADADYLRT